MLCILNRLGSALNGGTILHKKKRKTAFWQTTAAAARNSISMRAFYWLIINEPVFFEVLKDGGGKQSKSILVCDINQMGEKVSAKTMAIDDKTGKKGFGNDD